MAATILVRWRYFVGLILREYKMETLAQIEGMKDYFSNARLIDTVSHALLRLSIKVRSDHFVVVAKCKH